ncbi:MAG: phenylalanine--tRNA ligase subunit alpha [Patescibacteria group bacterium]
MNLNQLHNQAQKEIQATKDAKTLEVLRIKYLGRKSELTKILRSLAQQSLGERKKIGPAANTLKKELSQLFNSQIKKLETRNQKPETKIDLTLPGKKITQGHLHILTKVENEIRDIFKSLNFSVVEGPEVETEYNNFDALNIPQDHPARDMWDTFWLRQNSGSQKLEARSQKLLMRTHTSPMQIRYMQKHQPPFQIIVPGRVFRHEATDFSHEFNFHQIEGLMVGEDVSMAHLKFVIEEFFSRFFANAPADAKAKAGRQNDKSGVEVRLRPSYFPFVEPGVEIDVKMPARNASRNDAGGAGKGWLEMAGAGMVHPNVFKAVGYNPNNVQGFAFGFGMERLAMIKYNIPDIRLFHSGDLRFVRQF